jgi:hypothetical protein
VYSAAAFSGPINIGAIGFFRGTPGALGTGSFMLYVSTTSAAVDALNTTDFDANLGTSTTLFGTFRLDGGQAPEILTFSGTSYLYDPAAGNLLLDLRFVGSFLVPLNGDQPYPIAYFVARSGPPGGNYSRATTFGGGSAGYGLDTRFDAAATSVPEPATWVLAGTGLLLVGALSGRWHTERDR